MLWASARCSDADSVLTRLPRMPSSILIGPTSAKGTRVLRLTTRVAAEHGRVAEDVVASNKAFGRWDEVFGDDDVAAAMIDRVTHHALCGVRGWDDIDRRTSAVDPQHVVAPQRERLNAGSAAPAGRYPPSLLANLVR